MILNLIKKNYIILFVLFVPFILLVVYIKNSTANIVFQDQFHLLPIVDKYFSGNLSFQDLWRGHLEHRLLGYNLIFLGNAIFFHLNTLIEMYLNAVILLITSILLYINYRKSLISISREKIIQAAFFLVSFVVLSLNQWENIVFSLGMTIILKGLLFLISFVALDKIIIENKPFYLFIFIMSLTILVFGGGYSPALIGSMLMVLFFKCLIIDKEFSKKNLRVLAVVIATSAVLFLLYSYKIYDSNMIESNSSISQKIASVFHNPLSAIKYLLLSFSASLIGVDFYEHHMNQIIMLFIGGGILFLYGYSIRAFISSRMHDKTYLPLFLIFYSLIIFILTLIARLDFGVTYGMSSRYTTDTQYGLIGIIWVIIYYLYNKDTKLIKKHLLLFVLLLIFLGQIITNIEEWIISPYRKQHFLSLRNVAITFDLDNGDIAELKGFQYLPKLVIEGLKTLKKYNLNVYNDYNLTVGNTLNTAILGVGWYPKEENFWWINREVKVIIKSGHEGKLVLKGYVPEFYEKKYGVPIEVKIFIADELLSRKALSTGIFVIEEDIKRKNSILNLRLILSKSFIPSQEGLNNDSRELGIMIHDLTIK